MRLRLDLVVLAVAFVAGVYLWQSPSSRWLSISVLSVSGIFGLILIAAFVVIPPLVFRREPKFKDEYSLAFGEQGIHFSTAHIDSQLQWSLYSRALIDRH